MNVRRVSATDRAGYRRFERVARAALGFACAFVFASCAAKAPSASSTPGAANAPHAPSSQTQAGGASTGPKAPGASPTAIPIGLSANRVGKRYVFLRKSKGKRKVYTLRADAERGHYFGADTGVSTFVNPHVTFYGRDGKTLVADAPTGTVVEKEKTVRMSGGVLARAQDGLTLRCDTLRYDDEADLVHGDGNVVVHSPKGEELQGETLTWNLRDGSIDVAGAH